MNIEKEREAFEQWVSENGLNTKIVDGLYRSHVVGWMWHAWQARANLCTNEKDGTLARLVLSNAMEQQK